MSDCTTAESSPSARRPPSWRRRLCFWIAFLIYLAVLTELGTRAYWKFVRKLSFFDTSEIWYTFYPEWANTDVDHIALDKDDGIFDVLILGGSVVNEGFGDIGVRFEKGLAQRLGRPVRVCNLSFAARTSRDSLIKYRALERQHFDLVVVYHGINDTRMNGSPAKEFRDDYSHCAWYHKLQLFQQHREKKWLVFPFTLRYMAVSIIDQLPLDWYTPRMNPRDQWLDFGQTIKTGNAFRENLSEIVSLAQRRGARVLLMTFAYHLPHALSGAERPGDDPDYASGTSLVGVWGRPQHVALGIDTHNRIVKDIVAANPHILFVDQQVRMPGDSAHYFDCCHFTGEGCGVFVRNILDGVSDQLAQRVR